MANLGLDPEQVRNLARAFDQKAEDIEGVLRQLKSGLQGTEWFGPDRDKFNNDFDTTITTNLRQLERALRDTANSLRDQAREQEQASR